MGLTGILCLTKLQSTDIGTDKYSQVQHSTSSYVLVCISTRQVCTSIVQSGMRLQHWPGLETNAYWPSQDPIQSGKAASRCEPRNPVSTPISTYQYKQVYTSIYWFVQEHTSTYQYVLVYKSTYQSILVCSSMYQYVQVYTSMYQSGTY
jgi:hypothetical protein